MKYVYLFTLFGLLMVGCATKQPLHQKSVLVVWKTPVMQYADAGFLKRVGNRVELEIYQAGVALLRLQLTKRMCVNDTCISAYEFNKRFLTPYYPDRLLRDILLKRPIFDGRNLRKRKDGFVQKIHGDHLDIIYKIDSKTIYFKDTKNHIFIKIKELNE